MKDIRKRIPEGVSDALPSDCVRRRKAEQSILERFRVCGYDEVRTPVLEFLSLYTHGIAYDRDKTMVKTFDRNGRILTLRPEFTTPIARLVSTRMKNQPRPLRLCYLGVAFDNQYEVPGKRMEFTQAGVELLGFDGPQADAEVIALAASSMEAAGLTDYLIDIGQVDFFKGLMEEIGLPPDLVEQVRVSVEEKNSLSMEMLLRGNDVAGEALAKLMALPTLYGGAEVIHIAMGMTRSKRCHKALENLLTVYGILEGYGLSDHITIDLGMVHSVDYYTGVIFRGISGHLGAPILSGGRYDHLMDEFSESCPATGFALGIEHLLEALSRQGGHAVAHPLDVVVSLREYDQKNIAIVEGLRGKGMRVGLCYAQEIEAVRAMASQHGAKAMMITQGRAKEL